MRLHVGGYSRDGQSGIGVVDERAGELVVEGTVASPEHPSYLAASVDGRLLVAVHELPEGLLSTFAVSPDGTARYLATRPTGGAEPCHVSVHPSGRFALVAHWGDGRVTVLPLDADGLPGAPTDVVTTRDDAHAHMAVTDPTGRWVVVVHLGAGTVSTFTLDEAAGRLWPQHVTHLHAGAGPRHIAFAADATMAFLANELDSTMTALAFDAATGTIEARTTVSTVPAGPQTEPNFPAAIRVAPDGRHVYVANRGHDSVAVLTAEIAPRLVTTVACGGHWPRDLVVADGGRRLYVANERSDLVTELAVASSGLPVLTGRGVTFPRPTCVVPR